eukprot:1149671-Pelagomonas_calceolata.AAC.3
MRDASGQGRGVGRRRGEAGKQQAGEQAGHEALVEPGDATQHAEEAALAAHHAAEPEIVALSNRMELRQHDD